MSLVQILIFSGFALCVGSLIPERWRVWILFAGSLIAVYWLQPSTPIRNLDFWLPSATIGLTVFIWAVTRPPEAPVSRGDLAGGLLTIGIVFLIGLTRYFEPLCCLTPTRPPDMLRIGAALLLGSLAAILPLRWRGGRAWLPAAAIVLIILAFIFLKSEALGTLAAAGLRAAVGQSTDLASALDLRWLGFSYLAFRLLHTLRDYQSGRLPVFSLNEFVTYALFFPAFTSGPIDRSQHFVKELNSADGAAERVSLTGTLDGPRLVSGGERLLWGTFKKFVLADGLAIISLSAQNASQVKSGGWMWVLLYAYALRIYFDFSGYTDIALGLGLWLGLRLPENFERPYLKSNLTSFWNSWHITLAQWFRAYFFNPLTRALRSRPQRIPLWMIILAGQFLTMLLIGLWHGITWNFAMWGMWHGLGLFVHNRWADWARPRLARLPARPWLQRGLSAGGWLLTFNYVTLGWVWFALPNLNASWGVLLKLVGLAG